MALVALGCHSPSPAPAPSARAELAGDCAQCHRAETAEWNDSLHRAAFTDGDFQASFALEPVAFCFGCHAPEAHGRDDVRGAARGVGCTSCHEVPREHGKPGAVATTKSCTSCHEFPFPGNPSFMQSTVSEHARSPFGATSCTSCHLPKVADGHRDHRFHVSRNVPLLRAALQVVPRLVLDGVEIELVTRGVGHAMPTGDLFRRLVVLVRAEDTSGVPLGEEEIVLGRRFDRRHGVASALEDTRIEGRRVVSLHREWIARADRVSVTVRYERIAHALEVIDVRGERQSRDTPFASVLLSELVLDRRGALR